jgi:anthranilate phosphoribosyltransferase
MKEYTPHIRAGRHLTNEQAHGAFDQIMSGNVEENEIAEFLLALKDKGEVASEILGAARVLRSKTRRHNIPSNVLDVCGTGGDNLNTLNVSTAVAFVIAAVGVPVAKHGGQAVSSKSGSADVLHELGVNITNYDKADHCFRQSNMCFMFSPDYHETMKYVAAIRMKLKTRTIFNILGPLLNPAQATRQLIGVYDAKLLRVFAEVLRELGTEKAWIVHGAEGLDELSISGETHVVELEGGTIDNFTVTPEDAGLKRHALEEIKGGDAKYNAAAMVELFQGKNNAYREIVLLNAAAGLIVAGKVDDLKTGVQMAAKAIDSGAAMQVLEKLREITR